MGKRRAGAAAAVATLALAGCAGGGTAQVTTTTVAATTTSTEAATTTTVDPAAEAVRACIALLPVNFAATAVLDVASIAEPVTVCGRAQDAVAGTGHQDAHEALVLLNKLLGGMAHWADTGELTQPVAAKAQGFIDQYTDLLRTELKNW